PNLAAAHLRYALAEFWEYPSEAREHLARGDEIGAAVEIDVEEEGADLSGAEPRSPRLVGVEALSILAANGHDAPVDHDGVRPPVAGDVREGRKRAPEVRTRRPVLVGPETVVPARDVEEAVGAGGAHDHRVVVDHDRVRPAVAGDVGEERAST